LTCGLLSASIRFHAANRKSVTHAIVFVVVRRMTVCKADHPAPVPEGRSQCPKVSRDRRQSAVQSSEHIRGFCIWHENTISSIHVRPPNLLDASSNCSYSRPPTRDMRSDVSPLSSISWPIATRLDVTYHTSKEPYIPYKHFLEIFGTASDNSMQQSPDCFRLSIVCCVL